MCKGLAIITEKIDDEWIVYAKEGESSHDKILHELRDDLRYGKSPHLKFEVVFPNQIRDDIIQNCEYPSNWIEIQFGKKIACKDAFKAVWEYIYSHQNLLNFNKKILSSANLSGADLRCANLSSANLRCADLSGANLRYANLRCADLSGANLRYANLSYADLSYADLSDANLSYVDLSGAKLEHIIGYKS